MKQRIISPVRFLFSRCLAWLHVIGWFGDARATRLPRDSINPNLNSPLPSHNLTQALITTQDFSGNITQ